MSGGEGRGRSAAQPKSNAGCLRLLAAAVVVLGFIGGVVFIVIGAWSWFGPRPDPVSTLASRGVEVTAGHCEGYSYAISTHHKGRTTSQHYDGVQVEFTVDGKQVTAELADLHHDVEVNSRTYTEVHSGSYRCPLQVTYDPQHPTTAMATTDLDYYQGNAYRRTGEIQLGAGVLGVLVAVGVAVVMQAQGKRLRAQAEADSAAAKRSG